MDKAMLILFILAFNVFFPVFGYALTSLSPIDLSNMDNISIDKRQLQAAGVTISDGLSQNVTWEGGWFYYPLGNETFRVKWDNWLPFSDTDGFAFQRRVNWIDKQLNTWWFPYSMLVVDSLTRQKLSVTMVGATPIVTQPILNQTVLLKWDSVYSWSWVSANPNIEVFFTYNATAYSSLGEAMDAGTVIVTLAKGSSFNKSFDWWQAWDWYVSLMIGDSAFGVPIEISWIFRALTAFSTLAIVWFAKDLLSL